MLDILIRNGQILDGSGSLPFYGDVAIKGGRIVAVGLNLDLQSIQILDAVGAIVAPGFIDAHSHDDLALLAEPTLPAKLLQGVTSEVVGNCGLGCAPAPYHRHEELRQYIAPVLGTAGPVWDWTGFAGFTERLATAPKAINAVCQAAHGAIRIAAMGFAPRVATASELDRMCGLLHEAMAAGATGLSLGLAYAPGCYADHRELVALYKVVARYGGLLNVHLRSEGDRLQDALGEALRVGRDAGVPVHISHLKVIGRHNWGSLPRILEWLDDQRSAGADVTCDVYPYEAGSTTLTQLLPKWALEGGVAPMLRLLEEPAQRERIARELELDWPGETNLSLATGWERIFVAGCEGSQGPSLEGRSLLEISEDQGTSPGAAVVNILRSAGGQATINLFQIAEKDIASALQWPHSMIGSDGLPLQSPKLHPRHYGTFPRILARYVREQNVLTLPEAIRKMTSLPAARFRLRDRGRLAEGCYADVVVFRPDTVTDLATFADPRRHPAGIAHVITNGVLVATGGHPIGKHPGRYLPVTPM